MHTNGKHRIFRGVSNNFAIAMPLVPALTAVDYDPADLARIMGEAVAWMRGGEWSAPAAHACQPRLRVRESTPAT
jgi:DNA-binding LacI/PurR family transcriptional regulator